MAKKNKKSTKPAAKKLGAANANAAASNSEIHVLPNPETHVDLLPPDEVSLPTTTSDASSLPELAASKTDSESNIPTELPNLESENVNNAVSAETATETRTNPGHALVSRPKSVDSDAPNQTNNHEALAALQEKLEQVESERDEIQEEYDSLLERITLIKQKLEQRFKELESDTKAAKAETAEVRAENAKCRADKDSAEQRLQTVQQELAESERLASQLRDDAERAHTAESRVKSQLCTAETRISELSRESSDLHAKLAKEKEVTSEQRQTILAEQQKFVQQKNETDLLKSQLVRQKIMYDQSLLNERLAKENLEVEVTQLSSTLQNTENTALQSAQTATAQEQRIAELQTELEALRAQCVMGTQTSADRQTHLERERDEAYAELKQLRPQLSELTTALSGAQTIQQRLQTEAHENQLLIGKLRHEAVILNEHLTQALRMIRKDSEGSTVDKELISNLFVQYATCAAKDTKKFEILQLIANFLDWDDLRRQSTGLMRSEESMELGDLPPPQMVGFVGRLAEYLENRRARR